MIHLNKAIQLKKQAYITRDIERALGLGLDVPGFVIISNNTPFAKQIQQQAKQSNIILVEKDDENLLDTWQLLEHPTTIDALQAENITDIIVFKPTQKIERICEKQSWQMLNPSATLSDTIEEKISQVAWLDELTTYLPNHQITLCKNIVWNFEPFILQFNRAHTGSGTHFITSKKQLETLQEKFPERPVRISAYIEGPMFTNNNVVTKSDILIGSINYQITGMEPFTNQPFATVGNDWGLPKKILNYAQQSKFKEIAHAVGKKLQADGWRGAFGIDIALEEKTGELYLIEINARQPASVSFESQLQSSMKTKKQEQSLTTAEAHMAALLQKELPNAKLIPIDDGAQIILRNNENQKISAQTVVSHLQTEKRLTLIPYTNTKTGTDLLRIQSRESIMSTHTVWNPRGETIAHIIKTS